MAEYIDDDGEILEGRLDHNGHEVLDDTPVALPVRFKRPQTILDQMRGVIEEFNRRADEHHVETFEEANDFDVDDDIFPSSQFEITAAQEEEYHGEREAHYREIRDRDRKERTERLKGKTDKGDQGTNGHLQSGGAGDPPKNPGTGAGEKPPA